MPRAIRAAFAVIAGLATWFVVATVCNVALRAILAGYAQAEPAMAFSFIMLLARLALGALSSLCAGLACAMVGRSGIAAAAVLGGLLVTLFVPIHVGLWSKFPVWYHLSFLTSLLPITLLGFGLRGKLLAR
jgi:hypothetical protein